MVPLCKRCGSKTYTSWESNGPGTNIRGFNLCMKTKCGHKEYFPGEEPDLMENAFDKEKFK